MVLCILGKVVKIVLWNFVEEAQIAVKLNKNGVIRLPAGYIKVDQNYIQIVVWASGGNHIEECEISENTLNFNTINRNIYTRQSKDLTVQVYSDAIVNNFIHEFLDKVEQCFGSSVKSAIDNVWKNK